MTFGKGGKKGTIDQLRPPNAQGQLVNTQFNTQFRAVNAQSLSTNIQSNI